MLLQCVRSHPYPRKASQRPSIRKRGGVRIYDPSVQDPRNCVFHSSSYKNKLPNVDHMKSEGQ